MLLLHQQQWAQLQLHRVAPSPASFTHSFVRSCCEGTLRRAVSMAVRRTLQRRGVAGRLKENVDLGLPPKREVVLYTGLSKMQKQLYRVILTKNSSALGAANSRALVSPPAPPTRPDRRGRR